VRIVRDTLHALPSLAYVVPIATLLLISKPETDKDSDPSYSACISAVHIIFNFFPKGQARQ